MKQEILLVSENTVRKYSNISTNTQTHSLLPAIRFAHLEYELVVGTKLLNHLKELIETGDIELEENYKYKNLLDKSQPYLIFTTISELIILNAVKIDNFGQIQSNDEHIQNLTLKENFQLKEYYINKASQELKRLQMFIYEFYDDYKDDLINIGRDKFAPNLYSASNTSIFLGGSRGRGYKENKLRYKYNN